MTCLVAAGLDDDGLKHAAPFDLVFANILKGPLIALAEDMSTHTAPGGFAILSGILNEQSESVANHYLQFGYSLHGSEEIGDWTTLVLRR